MGEVAQEGPFSVVPLHDDPDTGQSLLDRIRAEAQEAVSDQTVDIRIPGWSTVSLVARYAFVDSDKTTEIGKRVRGQFKDPESRLVNLTLDLIVAACQGIYIVGDGGELEPLDPDGHGPVRYDARLADALQVEASKAREIVRAAFKGNDYAVMEHGQRLQRWLADTTRDVTDDALGEA